MALALCLALALVRTAAAAQLGESSKAHRHLVLLPTEAASNVSFALRGSNSSSSSSIKRGNMPCQCEESNPAWKKCARTVPKCVFIDLGAADGNTFKSFLHNGYGPVENCPNHGDFEAVLVEANPFFNKPLQIIAQQDSSRVKSMSSTAAYACEGTTSFYLDTTNHEQNYWGSSMSDNHPDTIKSGKQKVTVPTMNLNKLLYETTIPADYVLVKMDIEGSEYDVLPCLADSASASLVDALYLEQHPAEWSLSGTSLQEMETAKNKLKAKGVNLPKYFSQTL